jgi:hypothetical protein
MDAWVLRIEEASLEFVAKGGELIADQAKAIFIGGSQPAPWVGPNFPTPTSHTGFLRNSIGTDNVRAFTGGASSETGPRTVYGRRIELGYTGRGHFPYYTTRPFPFLKPGLEKALGALGSLSALLIRNAQEV